jgi:predicted TIM-barrel fold metal-dependent hydrolase
MSHSSLRSRFAALLLVVSLAPGAMMAQKNADPAGTPRARIVPAVAAHQHLMSPAGVALVPPEPPLASIQLPPELDQLLRRREKVSGAPPTGDLFTEDAIIQEIQEGRWIRGRDRIDNFLGFMEKDLHYVPGAFSAEGSTGWIAGTVRQGTATKEVLNFVLGLKKRAGGTWQIAAEIFTVIPAPQYGTPVLADQLVEELDDAGIRRGVVLSTAYWYGAPRHQFGDAEEEAKTRADNDWTVAQVSRHPDRLVAFCGVTVLADYAAAEIARCAKLPHVKGIKTHFANAGVDLRNPEHVAKVRRFFQAANANRMAIVAHVRTRGEWLPEHARIVLEQIIPVAPDVPIQIAHMGSSGGEPDAATAVFADAIVAKDPRARNLYFDITQSVLPDGSQSKDQLARMADVFRRIGLERIFFGTDMTGPGGNPPPREHWKAVRKLPLTDAELRVLAANVPPYMK